MIIYSLSTLYSLWIALGLLKFGTAFTATHSHHNEKLEISHPRRDRSVHTSEWREYCTRCQRPHPQCLCDHLPNKKIRLDTQILILQHPVEFRRKTISTVPLLKLILQGCQVLVGRSFDEQLNAIIDNAYSNCRIPLLLFPGPAATTLEDSDAIEKLANAYCGTQSTDINMTDHQSKKYLLIVVDGTWTQAKRMVRNSPALLQRCQSVQFTSTTQRSIYDSIRKQPDTYCLSTLESCEKTLRLLEPNNPKVKEASHHLLESLRAMILTQMKYERIYLEQNPGLVRNVSKLKAKKERQQQLLSSSIIERDTRCVNNILPEGYSLRPLVESDATYVNSRWPFQSNKSLIMIQKQIIADNTNATKFDSNTCLGIEFDGQLVACIIRHRNGSIGILHVDEAHRRQNLGEILLNEATDALARRGEEIFAFIQDGNKASEALFTKLGWEKANPLGKKGTG